jgi:hypothetical protein
LFCAPALIFGDAERVWSSIHILHYRTRYGRYRGCRVQFSCFTLLESFSTIPRASGLILCFFYPRLIFGGTEGVESNFHVLRRRTSFQRYRRYRVQRVQFACFAHSDSFSTVPRASSQVFMFYARGHALGGTEAPGTIFTFCTSGLIFDVSRVLGPIFMFCSLRLISGSTKNVGSIFHVLRSITHFGWYLGRRVYFLCFVHRDSFPAIPRALDLIFCFVLPDSFWTIPRASGPIFMFCVVRLVFIGTEGIRSNFHVLCS